MARARPQWVLIEPSEFSPPAGQSRRCAEVGVLEMMLTNPLRCEVRARRHVGNSCRMMAISAAATLGVAALAGSALAGPRYWDGNGGTGGAGNTGGNGTWTSSSNTWRDGSISGTLTTWSNEIAHFGDVP